MFDKSFKKNGVFFYELNNSNDKIIFIDIVDNISIDLIINNSFHCTLIFYLYNTCSFDINLKAYDSYNINIFYIYNDTNKSVNLHNYSNGSELFIYNIYGIGDIFKAKDDAILLKSWDSNTCELIDTKLSIKNDLICNESSVVINNIMSCIDNNVLDINILNTSKYSNTRSVSNTFAFLFGRAKIGVFSKACVSDEFIDCNHDINNEFINFVNNAIVSSIPSFDISNYNNNASHKTSISKIDSG